MGLASYEIVGRGGDYCWRRGAQGAVKRLRQTRRRRSAELLPDQERRESFKSVQCRRRAVKGSPSSDLTAGHFYKARAQVEHQQHNDAHDHDA